MKRTWHLIPDILYLAGCGCVVFFAFQHTRFGWLATGIALLATAVIMTIAAIRIPGKDD